MTKTKRTWFWPTFAVLLFLGNVGVILWIVSIAVNGADPIEGPPTPVTAPAPEGGDE